MQYAILVSCTQPHLENKGGRGVHGKGSAAGRRPLNVCIQRDPPSLLVATAAWKRAKNSPCVCQQPGPGTKLDPRPRAQRRRIYIERLSVKCTDAPIRVYIHQNRKADENSCWSRASLAAAAPDGLDKWRRIQARVWIECRGVCCCEDILGTLVLPRTMQSQTVTGRGKMAAKLLPVLSYGQKTL